MHLNEERINMIPDKIRQLFFELIRVSIGTNSYLSQTPSSKEWQLLFDIAIKQSLVGICFAGVQQLCDSENEDYYGMTELQYFTWMGMAVSIQQRNAVIDEQCFVIQERVSSDGYRSCILKGQGIAALYDDNLRELRQPGDIDIWIEGGLKAALHLAEHFGGKKDVTEQHVHLDFFEGTEVEAHFTPSMLRNPFANARLQCWFKNMAPLQFVHINEKGLCVPTAEFNLVYLLIHIYRHLFGDGVGLRQVMDYYYALLSSIGSIGPIEFQNVSEILTSLGLLRFAGAIMYVMHEVFGLDESMMICKQDVKYGKFLLDEIMIAGNMGHHDERLKDTRRDTRWRRFWVMTKHNTRLLGYYPAETLWAPFTRIKIWTWRKCNGWI